MKRVNYKENNKCFDCGRLICDVSNRCKSCSNKDRKGKYKIGKANKPQGFAYLKLKNPSKLKIICNNNKLKSKETIEKISGKNNSFYGKHHSKEARDKMKIKWNLNKEKRLKRLFQYLLKRPTSLEKKLNALLQKSFPNEWKYVGNGTFLIGYKNPDFVNINGKKICIEVYHDYFKIRDFGSCKNYEQVRGKHFAKYGWKTIFINGNELNDEGEIINKIKNEK